LDNLVRLFPTTIFSGSVLIRLVSSRIKVRISVIAVSGMGARR
jgi:hypothetical protein